jgi:hypothetical protein
MIRACACGALLFLAAPNLRAEETPPPFVPPPEPQLFAVRVAPEWGYRRFVDSEPSTTDKRYTASGIFALSGQVDVFPFRNADVLDNLGFRVSFAHAVALRSTDIDTTPPSDVGTTFYHYDLGVAYRPLRPGPFAWVLSIAYERWVFDFDDPSPTPYREVPTARYSLATVGGDVRLALGQLVLLGEADLLIPSSIASLGDREPTGGFGARGKLGVAYDFTRILSVDLSATDTLLSFGLRSVPGRTDEAGRVLDQYFVASLGVSVKP